MDGTQYVTEYGLERKIFSWRYDNIPTATKNSLVTLSKELSPFILHAPDFSAFECRPSSDSTEVASVFGVASDSIDYNVWSVGASFESLP
jgi:hypothetical protein